jgi:hypothetical protein
MASEPTDADFEAVSPGSLLPNPCTPDVRKDRRFRGIALHAPKEVIFDGQSRDPFFGAFARVVVAGAYCFDANYLDLRQQFLSRIVLVAVDAGDHRAFSGTMEPIANAVPVPSPFDRLALSPQDFAGRSVTGYFNPNLAQVLSLPEREAEYIVYAVLGAFVSNVVRIRVRRPKKR